MVKTTKLITQILDNLALKVMMVEPGDLSVVGELVSLAEELRDHEELAAYPGIPSLVSEFYKALGMLIMAELADTSENFERFGECIAILQNLVGREGENEAENIRKFCQALQATGYPMAEGDFLPAVAASAQSPSSFPGEAAHPAAIADTMPDFLQDVELLTGFIDETFEHLESIEANVLELEEHPDDREIINNIFRPFHTIKGVAGFLNLHDIQTVAHSTENLLDDVRNGERVMDAEVIEVVLKVGDFLRSMVENVKKVLDQGPEQYQVFDIASYVEWVKRVQAGSGGAAPLAKAAASAPSRPAPVAPATVMAPAPAAVPKPPSPPPVSAGTEAESAAPAAKKAGVTIKVDVEKLDSLVNAVGELVIMSAMVQENPLIKRLSEPKLTKDFAQLARITTELQKTAMAMRMVPIRQTFQKMIRLVRDLSKKTGKEVDLIMSGEETEIDRNMVDSIYDPLVHMMRNSVDHGVQTPTERQRVGKPTTGTVNLRAYQKGGNMVIEIEDDGQGLNPEKIRAKAIERGLIKEFDTLTNYELNNLIFMPGFSTAEVITDVSGRGVGMDVVKKAVEKLRGKVEVHSEPGRGTQCVIRLPLTLAIIDGIIVRVGSERYIIPVTSIQESLRPQAESISSIHGQGQALMVRKNLIPIIRLYEVFAVTPSNTDPCAAIIVVVENEGRQRALMVDELLGKQEVVIRSLGGLMQNIPGVAGGTILGDGRVGLILDLAGLIAADAVAG